MTTMNVSLTAFLKDWVEAQVRTGRYANASDYVRDLIRRDQETNEALIDALEKGAASGKSRSSIDDIWRTAKVKTQRARL